MVLVPRAHENGFPSRRIVSMPVGAKVCVRPTHSFRHSLNSPRRVTGSGVVAAQDGSANAGGTAAADVDKQQRGEGRRPIRRRMSAFGSVRASVASSSTCQLRFPAVPVFRRRD